MTLLEIYVHMYCNFKKYDKFCLSNIGIIHKQYTLSAVTHKQAEYFSRVNS